MRWAFIACVAVWSATALAEYPRPGGCWPSATSEFSGTLDDNDLNMCTSNDGQQVLADDGSQSDPSYSFCNATGDGFWHDGTRTRAAGDLYFQGGDGLFVGSGGARWNTGGMSCSSQSTSCEIRNTQDDIPAQISGDPTGAGEYAVVLGSNRGGTTSADAVLACFGVDVDDNPYGASPNYQCKANVYGDGDADFSGAVTADGGVTIGASGDAIRDSYHGSSTTDLGSIASQTCTDVDLTVTGSEVGDQCAAGVSADPDSTNGDVSVSCIVDANDKCTVRLCNGTAGAVDPPSITYSCRVFGT